MESLKKIQVKCTKSNGEKIRIRNRYYSNARGKTKKYTNEMIDWIAIYDITTNKCYFFPIYLLLENKSTDLHFRLKPTNMKNQHKIRYADKYEEW